ncbi:ribosome hibernation-promoting factor, HPF/YfiA family [Siphonobacter aquaeclarae]|jgi:putative sigma-54 modulation protein|uniref:Putative sigma-54 modulation protein n=1 Tax=Siphonobacter aquaeclarae TaxID=563176 RepID=A0A1G9KU57_9BACT|nr:ribosome-associated translation inhibitor RaiA [Siphonobacter aquaeclarae]MBO9637357.1 ribosome-associated translation inhibitor RaiA [Siphonobacter aquaeclarae]SDL53231.1 putative sigma-54 modulation protein [Siphonobacter aquaeclarae]
MKLQVQSVRFDADSKLLDFVQAKLNKLDQFYDRITSGEVYLKLDKGESSKVHNKIVEIKLYIPGGSIFVKESGTTFEEATDLALDVAKTQVKRVKEKAKDKTAPKQATVIVEEEEEIA